MSAHIATFATIFFSMILVNNYVLVQFLGICPFLGVSKKLDSSVGMGAAGGRKALAISSAAATVSSSPFGRKVTRFCTPAVTTGPPAPVATVMTFAYPLQSRGARSAGKSLQLPMTVPRM